METAKLYLIANPKCKELHFDENGKWHYVKQEGFNDVLTLSREEILADETKDNETKAKSKKSKQ